MQLKINVTTSFQSFPGHYICGCGIMCVPEEITVLLLSNLKMYHLFAINIEKFSFLKIMIFCKLEYLFEVFEQCEIFLSYPSLDLSTYFSTGTSQLGAHTRTLVWIISSFCHSLNNDSGMSEWLYKIDAHTHTYALQLGLHFSTFKVRTWLVS